MIFGALCPVLALPVQERYWDIGGSSVEPPPPRLGVAVYDGQKEPKKLDFFVFQQSGWRVDFITALPGRCREDGARLLLAVCDARTGSN